MRKPFVHRYKLPPRKCEVCDKMFKPKTVRTRGCSGPCLRELERRDDRERVAAQKRWKARAS